MSAPHAFRWIEWNIGHIAVHGVTPGEAESVVMQARAPFPEYLGDDKWRVSGPTFNGRYLQVIYLFDPDDTAFVIHARDLTEREKRRLRRRR